MEEQYHCQSGCGRGEKVSHCIRVCLGLSEYTECGRTLPIMARAVYSRSLESTNCQFPRRSCRQVHTAGLSSFPLRTGESNRR